MAADAKKAKLYLEDIGKQFLQKCQKGVVPYNHFETRYNERHAIIKDDLNLYLFQMHTEMPKTV